METFVHKGRSPLGAYELASPEHKRMVDELLAEAAANDGLAPVDLEQFWDDQDIAVAEPFGAHIPQVPLGAIRTWECVFDELGHEADFWRFVHEDPAWALDLKDRYNVLAERIVGRPLLDQIPRDNAQSPQIKKLHHLFEAQRVWEGGPAGSWWLKQSAHNAKELAALLDRVEARLENLPDFLLPATWPQDKARLAQQGNKIPLYRAQRGPCTFACSIFGPENLLMLYYDDPALMKRFSDVLARAILMRAQLLDREAGYDETNYPRGWSWCDDNCCLFTPQMYEFFAMPIHATVLGYYAPDPADRRYQHSDSDMAHLLPLLAELDFTGTNFGPTLTVSQIRTHCPHAVIEGQLAPFTYSRNEQANMVAEFLRDYDQAREKRGLTFATAGSINNGSRLTGMRLLMAAIQRYGRYD